MRHFIKRVIPLLFCLVLAICAMPLVNAAAVDFDSLYSDYSDLLVDVVVAKAGDINDEDYEALLVRWAALQSSMSDADVYSSLTDEQLDTLSAISLKIYTELAGGSIMMTAANDPDSESGDGNSVPLALVAEPVPFSVTVPSSIAISVDEYGVATAANFAIANHSIGDVRVSSLAVTPEGEWQLKAFGTIFDVNEKSFALKINNDDVADGFNAAATGAIAVDDTLTLPVTASVATQTAGYSGTIGNIVFVMSWVENGPVVDIEITTQPTKTAYSAGETFDATGMVVTAIHADGTGEVVTDAVTVDTTTPLTYGTTNVNVSYGGITKVINVSVDRTLASIAVTTQPTKTAYSAGETFDATGMVVTASYAYGDSTTVTNYTFSPSGAMSADVTEVTITYTEGGVTKTATTPVTVERISAGDVPSQSNTLTFNNSAQSPTWSGYDDTKMTLSGSTSETNAGTYNVTFTPKADYKWSDGTTEAKTVSWLIGKATPTVTAPSAKTSLTYTGSAQSLISAGSTSGGTLQYSLDGTNYSTGIPTGTNAGSYTVYYKVVGNDNYSDVAAQTVSVSIAKADFTSSVSISGYTYGGTKSTPSVTNNPGNGSVTYYGRATASGTATAWSSVTNTTYDAGTRYCYAVIAETTNYNSYTTGNTSFTISRATLSKPTVSKSSVSLGTSATSATFTVTRNGDGAITATSSDTGVATVRVNGTTVTVSSVNNTTGTAVITVKVNQGTNYAAYTASDVTVSVSASFQTAFEAASIGSVVTGGTFKINGVTTAPATMPYSSSYTSDHASDGTATGNLPAYSSSNTYAFGDSEGQGKDLKWVKVSDKLFIADRNLLCSISWNQISSLGFLNGSTTVTIEGKTYKIRLISGGESSAGGEWNTYVVNGSAGTSNSVWHWEGCYSWCSETTANGYSNCRPVRGYDSAADWNCDDATRTYWNYGFRPALELVG